MGQCLMHINLKKMMTVEEQALDKYKNAFRVGNRRPLKNG